MNHLSPYEQERRAKHRATYCNVYDEDLFDEVLKAINDDGETGSRYVYVKTKHKGWAIPASCFLDQDRRRWGTNTEVVPDNSYDRSRLSLDDSELSQIVAKAVVQSNMRDGDIADLVRHLKSYIYSREQVSVGYGKMLRDKEIVEEKVLWDNRLNGLVRLWLNAPEHFELVQKFAGLRVSPYVNCEGHNGVDVAFKLRFNDFYLGERGTSSKRPGVTEVLPIGKVLEVDEFGFNPESCALYVVPNTDYEMYGRWHEGIDAHYKVVDNPQTENERIENNKQRSIARVAHQLARNLSLFPDLCSLSAEAHFIYFVDGVFELTNNGIEGTATPTEDGVTWRFVEHEEIILTSKGNEVPKKALPYLFAMFPDSMYERVIYRFEIQP